MNPRRVPWVNRRVWSVMCILSCVSAPLMAVPLSIIVTALFMGGFNISANYMQVMTAGEGGGGRRERGEDGRWGRGRGEDGRRGRGEDGTK